MAKQKPQRWFLVQGDHLHIYNSPYARTATSVSIVGKADLPYYRSNFNLQVAWEHKLPAQ